MSVAAFVRATHPVPAAGVTLVVGAAVVVRGASPAEIALATLSTLLGQLSVGWSNDYLDRLEDAEAGRTDKPIVAGRIRPSVLWGSAVAAGIGSVLSAVPLGLPAAAVMTAAVGSAWVYNLGIKRTTWSWVPYAVSFGLAPAFVWLAAGEPLPPPWLSVVAALLGVAGHLTNVAPDLARDIHRRSLPHRLGLGGSLGGACALLLAALAIVMVAGPRPGPVTWLAAGVAALLVGAVAWAGWTGRLRTAFHLTIAAAAAVVSGVVPALPV